MALDHHDMSPELSKILLFGNYVSIHIDHHQFVAICATIQTFVYFYSNMQNKPTDQKKPTDRRELCFYQIDVGWKKKKN